MQKIYIVKKIYLKLRTNLYKNQTNYSRHFELIIIQFCAPLTTPQKPDIRYAQAPPPRSQWRRNWRGGGIIEMWGPGYIIYIDLLPHGAGLCPHNNYFLPMPLVCPYPPASAQKYCPYPPSPSKVVHCCTTCLTAKAYSIYCSTTLLPAENHAVHCCTTQLPF